MIKMVKYGATNMGRDGTFMWSEYIKIQKINFMYTKKNVQNNDPSFPLA